MATANRVYTANNTYSRRVDLRRDPANNDQWQMNRMVQAARYASWGFSCTGWIPCNAPDMIAHGLPVDALDMDQFILAVNAKKNTV